MLYAEGILQAKLIGEKIVGIINFAKDALSKDRSYDWGLRYVKSFIRFMGMNKRSRP